MNFITIHLPTITAITIALIAFLLVWEQCRHHQLAKIDRMYHDRELRRETARHAVEQHSEKVGKAA